MHYVRDTKMKLKEYSVMLNLTSRCSVCVFIKQLLFLKRNVPKTTDLTDSEKSEMLSRSQGRITLETAKISSHFVANSQQGRKKRAQICS